MIAERLKALRLERGLKQKDILSALDLSSARYSQYESGKRMPSLDQLMRFADFYNVTLDYLVGRTDDRNLSVYSADVGGRHVVYEAVGSELTEQELSTLKKLLEKIK